jgi:hypothetical protein
LAPKSRVDAFASARDVAGVVKSSFESGSQYGHRGQSAAILGGVLLKSLALEVRNCRPLLARTRSKQ